jgi:hypothetical protein
MVVKARLKVQLLADDVIVAESDSSILWQSVLQAMDGDPPLKPLDVPPPLEAPLESPADMGSQRPGSDAIGNLARDLKIDRALVEGACGPTLDVPYIHLDRHHWESLKKNTAERGPTAIPGVILAATLLVLWWRSAGKTGTPSIGDITPVLHTLHLSAFNLKRSVENCRWLQLRGASIALNPSRFSSAVAVARAYCLQQPVEADKD